MVRTTIKVMPIKPSTILLLLCCFLFSTSCSPKKTEPVPGAQDTVPITQENTIEEVQEEPSDDIGSTFTDQYGNTIYTVVDQKPAFEGGEKALNEFLSTNLKYPSKAMENNAQGTVMVAFIVSKDGSIRNVELASGVDESSLNQEAMRVVSEMPNWIPGLENGEKVNVKYTLPIRFQLHRQNQ